MNMTYLNKLEYFEILNILASFSNTYIGKNMCLDLLPSKNQNTVKNLLAETNEAVRILYKNGNPPINSIADNSINIKTLESNGILSLKSILELINIFDISNKLKNYFYTDFINIDDFPVLNSIFSDLYTNNSIIEKMNSTIIDENTLDDKASSNLFSIRKKQRNIEQDIKAKLNNFIHSSTYSKYIQENIITIRNERFVIPIKEEYRSQIKGFIHDISSSGSTIFIEPISIFELNNELANLKIEENLEIEKILQELSNILYPYLENFIVDIECIGKLDFIFAKAKYSKSINAITPTISEKKEIVLKNAKHPLLDQSLAVPFSLTLGSTFNTLVITGPNTGGKTVTLKTIGLLTCMASSGLNIPASENCSIHVFDNVFADIGDDQSISDSLSTFSSHIKNIVDIINNSTSNSLILVDELGSGTDPLEGASLAISVLNYFNNNNSLTVATTHYQELKKYALLTDNFENASVEFDINTMSPTYHLLVGIPGKSNAFEISKKLGLSDNIILDAKSKLSKKDLDFEELLKNIYDNKSKIEEEKVLISSELEKVSILKKELEKDNSKLLQQEKDIINNAKIEARNILLNAKESANEIISEMNKLSSTSDNSTSLNNLRNKLNNHIKELSITNNIQQSENTENCLDMKYIKPDTEVFVTTLNKNGIIVSNISKSNEVQVQIGSIKTNINIKYLKKIDKKHINTSSVSTNNISKTKIVNSELNVIGLNVDEAILIVDKFLDDSSLANLETVRIVHGKGTGKLRTGIHKFLKTNSQVKSFRIGTYGEGEMGVTIVKLK